MFTDTAFWVLWLAGACAVRGLPEAAVTAKALLLAATGLAGVALVLPLSAAHTAVLALAVGWTAMAAARTEAPVEHPIRRAFVIAGPLLLLWVLAKHAGLASAARVAPLAAAGLSYLIVKAWTLARDRADGRAPGCHAPAALAYLLFLPTYLSGPMHYYGEFEAGLRRPATLRAEDAVDIGFRFLAGLVKVQVLAPLLAPLSLLGMAGGEPVGPGVLAGGALLYSLVLYLDFSGYSDLAIAAARAAGVGAPENFLRPYLAPNIREFWRRWHVSFSRVLTAYVFVPVTRSLQRRTSLAPAGVMIAGYLITFGLAGYWHGPTWRFVAWGLYHACGLIVYDLVRQRRVAARLARGVAAPAPAGRVATALSVAATVLFVSAGWVLFVPGVRLW
ncbi:MAG: MBOAT family O-acyltransferase [Vicinamibacterales bacterium]